MNHFLSDLLYYNISDKRHKELKRSLEEYQLLLNAFHSAIDAMEIGDLEKFDSLVGENACQIRAVRIALIHNNYTPSLNLKHCINHSIEKIGSLLENQVDKLMLKGDSLKEVFDNFSLDVEITDDEKFFLKSFLLTEMKEVLSSESFMETLSRKSKCTPIKIKKFHSNVSYTFTGSLASHLRKLLSKASVEFVQKLASDAKDESLDMISNQYIQQHNALDCIPMFWTYKILLKAAQEKKIPLIVRVKFLKQEENGFQVTDEKRFFFKAVKNENGDTLYVETSNIEDTEKAAWVFQGVACTENEWDQETFLQSITDAILAGAADHRQYPNPELKISHPEFEKFKDIALEKGFAFQNPKTFFIQHVYPSKINKALRSFPC